MSDDMSSERIIRWPGSYGRLMIHSPVRYALRYSHGRTISRDTTDRSILLRIDGI